jgi:hypothetical protein
MEISKVNFLKHHEHEARWFVLIFQSLLLFGTYYAYDIPAAIKSQVSYIKI